MIKFVNISIENEDYPLTDNLEEVESLAEDISAYQTSRKIENVLTNKVNNGEDLTDQEIYIAAETIGTLYYNLGDFKGFGFEDYEGKTLSQTEKSKIAIEAISNQNKEKGATIAAKLERFGNELSDYFSWFTGSMSKLRKEAQEVLRLAERSPDESFTQSEIEDKRVSKAIQRGSSKPPFKNYNDVIRAVGSLIDSVKIIASISKYESLFSGKDSKWDLTKLAEDMGGHIIKRSVGKVTYDLNPERLAGALLTATVPDNSDNNYLMRNLKANFVISLDYDIWRVGTRSENVKTTGLTKRDTIALLKQVIKYIDEEEEYFKQYYKVAKFGITDFIKNIFKAVIPFGSYNSLIFRSRIQNLNSHIHYINHEVLRGLIAWAADSID